MSLWRAVQERRRAAAVQDRTEAKPSVPIWQEEPADEQPRKHATLRERFQAWREDDGGSISPFITLYNTAAENWKRARRRWRHIVREKKAKHFPESEQKAVQLLLFGWSLVPMVGRRLREAMLGRRKKNGRLMARPGPADTVQDPSRGIPGSGLCCGRRCGVLLPLYHRHHRYL